MTAFKTLYTLARLLVVVCFVSAIILSIVPAGRTGAYQIPIVIGMGLLGLTPIFGLAIAGATWLRTRLTDTVGWVAVVLALFIGYLWFGR